MMQIKTLRRILILPIVFSILAFIPVQQGDRINLSSGDKTPLASFSLGDVPLPTPTPNICKSAIDIPYNEIHWTYLPLENSAINLTGEMTNFYVNDLVFLSSDEVLAGTSRELLRLTNKKSLPVDFRSKLLSEDVEKIEIDPDGKWWFTYEHYHADNWISSWDGKKEWKNYSFPGNTVDIAITKSNVVWVTYAASETSKAGIKYFKNETWHTFTLGDGSEEDNTVLALLATSDGAIWFSTSAELFQLKNEKVTRHTRQLENIVCDELKSPENQHLAEGPDGTIWGNFGYLLYNFDGKNWKTYYSPHFRDEILGGLAVAKDGAVWAGKGFLRNGQIYIFKLPFTMINTIDISPDGTIWYGTYAGIYIYDNKEF